MVGRIPNEIPGKLLLVKGRFLRLGTFLRAVLVSVSAIGPRATTTTNASWRRRDHSEPWRLESKDGAWTELMMKLRTFCPSSGWLFIPTDLPLLFFIEKRRWSVGGFGGKEEEEGLPCRWMDGMLSSSSLRRRLTEIHVMKKQNKNDCSVLFLPPCICALSSPSFLARTLLLLTVLWSGGGGCPNSVVAVGRDSEPVVLMILNCCCVGNGHGCCLLLLLATFPTGGPDRSSARRLQRGAFDARGQPASRWMAR